jgi:DNA polymerase III epsilon subunit-like protein
MPSPNKPPVRKRKASTKIRKCSGCGGVGHDRRNCPAGPVAAPRKTAQKRVVGNDGVEETCQEPSVVATIVRDTSTVDLDKALYVVFDLETTGRSRQRDEIIKVAAQILDPNGIPLEDAIFLELVKPNAAIPPFITELTSITNDSVSTAERFPEVARAFIKFMCQHSDEYSNQHVDVRIEHIILVAHNGKVFDIPFLIQQLSENKMVDTFFQDKRFGFGIDTLHLARKSIQANKTAGIPVAYNLAALHQYVTGHLPTVSHRAMADVKATISVLFYQHFWENRGKCLFSFGRPDESEPASPGGRPDEVAGTLLDDSDTSVDSEMDNSVETTEDNKGETTEDEDSISPAGDQWEQNYEYRPSCPLPSQLFQEHFVSSGRSKRQRIGLQCSPIDVNTPIRAWREVFRNTLLEKIVRYTNEYGRIKAKRWQDIDRRDLESFIAVLFVSAIQKRKDKPSNWFSENRLLESPTIKKIMSGRKFFTILRYLHCCSMENQPVGEDYDPTYKIKEIQNYLEDRYNRLFIPGQQLSLDETLIRAFGRIKFKVRIVTKAARYGIKLYVVTDAVTAFVLKVVIYTGKSTYYETTDQQEKKKTVQIVEQLVQPFVGTYRTIYVDRFYTSLDLLKSLADKNLYVTGTMLANRIPLSIRTAKTSSTFKK